MNKTRLLDTMRTERAQWEALLNEVGEARVIQPNAIDEWSIKDIVVHVMAYEQWLIDWLEAQGEKQHSETKSGRP